MDSIIYIGTVGGKALAGDAFLSAVFLKEPITDELLIAPKRPKEDSYTTGYFESLKVIKDSIVSEVTRINCDDLKLSGVKFCIRNEIDRLIATLCLRAEISKPLVLITESSVPNPKYYETRRVKRNPETKLANAISYLHFRERMRYYSQIEEYKKYRFEWHYGLKSHYHMKMIFKHGPSNLHKLKAVEKCAIWLYDSVNKGHKTVKPYATYLKDSPPWWKHNYGNLEFTACLTEEKKQNIDGLLYSYLGFPYKTSTPYPNEMLKWIDDNSTEGLIDLEKL